MDVPFVRKRVFFSFLIIGYLIYNIIWFIRLPKEDRKSKENKNRLIRRVFFAILIWILYYFLSLIMVTAAKPIIYLYPTEQIQVSVKLGAPQNITCSYPKYPTNGWNVLANPNGDLKDLDTNKNLYALYYESEDSFVNSAYKVKKDGFVVKGADSAEFLEEKLAYLGLSDREIEEFIVYWLPKLEANKYNYIRFATYDEIENSMPLTINPKPDTLIRVMMTFKGLSNPIQVEEQKLEKKERVGFVAVEWGGSEIK